MVEETTALTDIEKRLVLPDKSTASSVLNGVGNGMMLTGLPLFAVQSYTELAGKPLFNKSDKFAICNLVAIAVGAVIGGIYGKREADEVNNYRRTLRSEINNLHKRLDAQRAPAKSWADDVKSDGAEISR